MSIKNFFSAQKKEKQEYFWSLIIEANSLQAAVWRVSNKALQILSSSPPTPWEKETLLDATDTALSSAIQALPEDTEPTKTVFGLPASWVSESQIKPKYLDNIKQICQKLSLKPVGFVSIPEAIAHLHNTIESSPLTAILVGVNKDNLEISIFKYGEF